MRPLSTDTQEKSRDSRYRVLCLANWDYRRGLDRLLDLAEVFKKRGDKAVQIIIAGNMKLRRSDPGYLGVAGRKGGTLEKVARQHGLTDEEILFLDHVTNPEAVLASCDAVIKPTRESNPWGRDIIEGMAAGKPVLSVGSWDRFIRHKDTGILIPIWDAEEFANEILYLAHNRDASDSMGDRAQKHIASLCGPERAKDLAAFWCSVNRRQS
ncbi:MAG: glycosyltransferase [Alphaproteobacteria bacterium]